MKLQLPIKKKVKHIEFIKMETLIKQNSSGRIST